MKDPLEEVQVAETAAAGKTFLAVMLAALALLARSCSREPHVADHRRR